MKLKSIPVKSLPSNLAMFALECLLWNVFYGYSKNKPF